MSVEIRPATTEDVPAIREVATASWHDTYEEVIGARAVEATLADWYDPEALEAQVTTPSDVFLVAVDDGVVGFANAGPDTERTDVHQLWRLYVTPDRTGEGVGSALLDAVEDALAPDRSTIELTVLAQNDRARAFYEEHGFELVDRRPTSLPEASVVECVYRKAR